MANHLALAATLEPGDEALVEQPTYELLTVHWSISASRSVSSIGGWKTIFASIRRRWSGR